MSDHVEPGNFPYPLTDGPTESPFLTWLRNHSNYMAVRGFLDYFRMAAILMRGILINFLVVIPYLMMIALVLSLIYGTLLADWQGQVAREKKLEQEAQEHAAKAEKTKGKKAAKDGAKKQQDDSLFRAKAPKIHDKAPVDVKPGSSLFLFRPAEQDGWAKWMQDNLNLSPPYLLTPVVLVLSVAWILLFPIFMVLYRIGGYRRALETGSDSSVKDRDLYERSFGGCLLAIVTVALVESFPLLVHFYNQYVGGILSAWQETLTFTAAALVALSSSDALMKLLSGATQKVVMAILGMLGLLAPVMFVVFVMDFLVYVECPPEKAKWALFPVLLLPLAYVFGITLAIIIGLFKATFQSREYIRLVGLLLGIVIFHVLFLGVLILATVLTGMVDPGFLPEVLRPSEGEYSDWGAQIVLVWAFEIGLFCWLTVDVNMTSIHSLYRDRLASAYLLCRDTEGNVDIEQDVPLGEICCHETGSTAPYHLVNVALNLQGSQDIGLRDRQSDFFIFSKKFIGGSRTGYCRSQTMQLVFPQIDLASAMAISAAAASPNMGRGTSPALVAFMTMLNIRLGVWIPNPGLLEEQLAGVSRRREYHESPPATPGFTFAEVFQGELEEIKKRWEQLGFRGASRMLSDRRGHHPSPEHGLVGIGFSGGGIRSATVNLGIAQALHHIGIFDHIDYMSTVSGGGYLGSSISTLMRFRTAPVAEIAGSATVHVDPNTLEKIVTITPPQGEPMVYRYSQHAQLEVRGGEQVAAGDRLVRRPGPRIRSEIAGRVQIEKTAAGEQVVRVVADDPGETREYRFTKFDELNVKPDESIEAGRKLIQRQDSFGARFRWQVPPRALLREMTMRLDEKYQWVNVSDGGHIENLAAIELLRRRCKLVIIGDGEADPKHFFNGLATLIRTASIDLGVHIEIRLDMLRLDDKNRCERHWALGRVRYPGENAHGYLLYLKSSFTGIDENEAIGEYRNRKDEFPHESTADQFFDEGQFEAYRSLGQLIGEQAIRALRVDRAGGPFTHAGLIASFERLWHEETTKLTSTAEDVS